MKGAALILGGSLIVGAIRLGVGPYDERFTSYTHQVAHAYGSYNGYPIMSDVLVNGKAVSGFVCVKCGRINVDDITEPTPEETDSLTRATTHYTGLVKAGKLWYE